MFLFLILTGMLKRGSHTDLVLDDIKKEENPRKKRKCEKDFFSSKKEVSNVLEHRMHHIFFEMGKVLPSVQNESVVELLEHLRHLLGHIVWEEYITMHSHIDKVIDLYNQVQKMSVPNSKNMENLIRLVNNAIALINLFMKIKIEISQLVTNEAMNEYFRFLDQQKVKLPQN